MLNILVVDDEPALRESLTELLSSLGHHVVGAATGLECMNKIRSQSVDLVLLDVNLPHISGLDCLKQIKELDPSITVLIITAHGNIADAVEATKNGAFNYVEKPISSDQVQYAIAQAIEAREMVKDISFSLPQIKTDAGEVAPSSDFIGKSAKMKGVFTLIHRVSQVNTSVFIRGENGTGKELVARAIHFNSPRKNKKFVAVNCGAIAENLAESEFFGHEKGAFTGAETRKIGKFQYAEGGTLFLDEVGEISPTMQVKLLRVLQEKAFTPVGSNRDIKTDVRIIAATNRKIEQMIADGRFREDLYYRLNVIPITLPPLRERVEDIPHLVNYFIEKFNKVHGNHVRGIDPNALTQLMNCQWPGNIRELENTIERAFVMETSPKITLSSLPDHIRKNGEKNTQAAAPTTSATADFQGQKEQFEKEFIINALKTFHGRINQTAQHAGIPKNTLLRKIKKYGINPRLFGTTDDELED